MISILLPTCHRPALLRQMLQSLRDTTGEYEIEIVAVIDEDDETLRVVSEFCVDVTSYSPKRRGALSCWNKALRYSSGDILVPCGDDQTFYPKWLDYALESHKEKLGDYGVVGMNDLAYNGNTQVATMFLFDRKYCKEQMGGIFAPPMYRYYCIDSEWNEKAKMLGRFYWDERSIVEHLHSAHGKRPVDEHDRSRVDLAGVDNKTFEDRKARSFPVEWEPLI